MTSLVTSRAEDVGVVVIGRNEGERLGRCLNALGEQGTVIYVDSGSDDGSARLAAESGAVVLELDGRVPFTAARARNSGFQRVCEAFPRIRYVQFVDGDCELSRGWVEVARLFLNTHPEVGVVCGRLRERFADETLYNWLCDREWDQPSGEVRQCGGIAMMRVAAVAAVGGFRDDMIAGEEPEMCVRLRASGWRIWRLSAFMAFHDAAMKHFRQWWRRAMRGGYAFALGARLHGGSPEFHGMWECRRAWLWGLCLPLACFIASLVFWPFGLSAWLIYPLQMLRQTMRNSGTLLDRTTLAVFQLLSRFPEAIGQLKFIYDRHFGRSPQLIEYK